jgi:hypothetical protein
MRVVRPHRRFHVCQSAILPDDGPSLGRGVPPGSLDEAGPPVKHANCLQAMFNKAANWVMMGARNQ